MAENWLHTINIEKLLKHYRRYRIARLLLLNPVSRILALVTAGLLLIVIWPFALIYLAYRTIRFSNKLRRQQRFTKNRDIIDI